MRQITRLCGFAVASFAIASSAIASTDVVQTFISEQTYIASPAETRGVYVMGVVDGISTILYIKDREKYDRWVACTSKMTGHELAALVDARITKDKTDAGAAGALVVAVNDVCKLNP